MPDFNTFRINEKLLTLVIQKKYDHVDTLNPYKVADGIQSTQQVLQNKSYLSWRKHIKNQLKNASKPAKIVVYNT